MSGLVAHGSGLGRPRSSECHGCKRRGEGGRVNSAAGRLEVEGDQRWLAADAARKPEPALIVVS